MKLIFRLVLTLFLLIPMPLWAGDVGNKIGLECMSIITPNEKEEFNLKVIIDTQNKTVENLATGELFTVKTFSEKLLSFEFKFKSLTKIMNINRLTGDYSEFNEWGSSSWTQSGKCQRISIDKIF